MLVYKAGADFKSAPALYTSILLDYIIFLGSTHCVNCSSVTRSSAMAA